MWAKSPKTRRITVAVVFIAVGALIAVFRDNVSSLFKGPDRSFSKILVLDNCDSDFRNPPFQDAVVSFAPNGKPVGKLKDLNLCQTVGGGRMLSASPDGRFFLVCENVAGHLIACETQTGKQLWRLDGEFTAATVAPDGTTYAVISSGTIYGDQTAIIDQQGQFVKQTKLGGFDLVIDPERDVLWLVGAAIKKCDLDLTVLRELDPIAWCAVSVDLNPDGSVWVAERDHPDVTGSTNRLLKISPGGRILKTVSLDFSPLCLRVDRSDGSVWVTGGGSRKPLTATLLKAIEKHTGPLPTGKSLRNFLTRYRYWSRTQKFDAEGKLLRTIRRGGHTLDIDPVDGSVWIAAEQERRVYRYTREGIKRGGLAGLSDDQKYVVVVPEGTPARAAPQGH